MRGGGANVYTQWWLLGAATWCGASIGGLPRVRLARTAHPCLLVGIVAPVDLRVALALVRKLSRRTTHCSDGWQQRGMQPQRAAAVSIWPAHSPARPADNLITYNLHRWPQRGLRGCTRADASRYPVLSAGCRTPAPLLSCAVLALRARSCPPSILTCSKRRWSPARGVCWARRLRCRCVGAATAGGRTGARGERFHARHSGCRRRVTPFIPVCRDHVLCDTE